MVLDIYTSGEEGDESSSDQPGIVLIPKNYGTKTFLIMSFASLLADMRTESIRYDPWA